MKFRRNLFVLGLIAITSVSLASDFPAAEKIIVEKEKRKLHLLKDDEIFQTFEIALGIDPVGDKEAEGDFKTPEGVYALDTRNPNSAACAAPRSPSTTSTESCARSSRAPAWAPCPSSWATA